MADSLDESHLHWLYSTVFCRVHLVGHMRICSRIAAATCCVQALCHGFLVLQKLRCNALQA